MKLAGLKDYGLSIAVGYHNKELTGRHTPTWNGNRRLGRAETRIVSRLPRTGANGSPCLFSVVRADGAEIHGEVRHLVLGKLRKASVGRFISRILIPGLNRPTEHCR